MFELVVILTRYLFLFYIAYFLFQAVMYILIERGRVAGNKKLRLSKQRLCIVFLHLTAFLVISYKPSTFTFDVMSLVIGVAVLVFFVFAKMLTDRIYEHSCGLVWNGVALLFDVGIIMLQRLKPEVAVRQLIFAFAAFLLILFIPVTLKLIPRFEKLELVYLIGGWAFIVLPFIFGFRQYGAVNWIKLGGFVFQPSEIVKFLYIFYLASVLRKRLSFKQLIFPTAMAAGYVLVLVAQTDLGGALIFFMTYMIMMYIGTGRELLFISGLGAFSVASVIAYRVFPHIRVRVSAWLDPWASLAGDGYQITQSLFAITTWGFMGSGLTRGTPYKIPVYDKDFIFPAICEEFGPLFGIALIGVYIMLFYRGAHISLRCDRRFYSLLAGGITCNLAFQTFLILGGVIAMIPLTGVTLPFVSYGGSSIVVSILMLGLLQWIMGYYERFDKDTEVSEECL